jgi:hypothetical protein
MSDFNTCIIEEFGANGGKVSVDFDGCPLILLHHLGSKSGTERVTPVACFPQSDGRLVVWASNGGAVSERECGRMRSAPPPLLAKHRRRPRGHFPVVLLTRILDRGPR